MCICLHLFAKLALDVVKHAHLLFDNTVNNSKGSDGLPGDIGCVILKFGRKAWILRMVVS